MGRHFLHLAYDGSNYRGWQTQACVKTVQQTIEEALSKRLGRKMLVHGCGRTDAEVHAYQYFCHLDLREGEANDLVFILNKMLPNDIVIYDLIPVSDRANAQRNAIARTYVYRLHSVTTPFLRLRSWQAPNLDKLNLPLMRLAAEALLGKHDCSGLCRQPDQHNNTMCRIDSFQLHYREGELHLQITADHFLRSMVRIIVQRVLEVGSGKVSLQEWTQMITDQHVAEVHTLAPARGLYLTQVLYPSLDLDTIGYNELQIVHNQEK